MANLQSFQCRGVSASRAWAVWLTDAERARQPEPYGDGGLDQERGVKQKERRRARGDGRIGWQRGRGPQFAGRRENDSHRGKRRGVRMGRPKCLARATMRRLI